MRLLKILVILHCAATFAALAAEEPCYVSSLHVDNPKTQQSVSNDEKKSGKRRSRKLVTTKTTSRSLSWPVSVSFSGKSIPSDSSVKLVCHFIGMEDGRTCFLGVKTLPVVLDGKGVFKTVVTSPTETIVNKKVIKQTRRRRGGGSISMKSETTGSRVTGCIIQLTVKGVVERAFASQSRWSRHAKKSPLPESEILK